MKQQAQGFTMIEILVSIFVFAVGILGAGAMQVASFHSNQNNLHRTQAIIIADQIIDHMRANTAAATNGSAFDAITTSDSINAPSGCSTDTGCSAADSAALALANWKNTVSMIGNKSGIGTISREAGTNNYTITIAWNDRDRSTTNSSEYAVATAASYSVKITL